MKVQDILFIVALVLLLMSRRPIWYVWAGLVSLILAIPLFSGWIFFTAERLTWYAAGFFAVYLLFFFHSLHKVQ
ncbi:hypothetical protein HY948_03915 [Candidatus Gottesmanbacteria bacterium]|nr:hypothetical protein [Candidatus Gottesmanbacteria bacterium]